VVVVVVLVCATAGPASARRAAPIKYCFIGIPPFPGPGKTQPM
jgi:hypothetical protein